MKKYVVALALGILALFAGYSHLSLESKIASVASRAGATILPTAASDTLDTFRTNVNSSLASLSATLAATTSSNTWTGLQVFASASTTLFSIGSGGTTAAGMFFGTCNLRADTLIAASSTGLADCAATGVVSGDNVRITLATTTVMAQSALFLPVAYKASTTAGWITVVLYNATGASRVPSAGGTGIGSSTQWQIWR